MPGKPISEEAIQTDLRYAFQGTPHLEWFKQAFECVDVEPPACVLEPGCGSGKFGLWFADQGHAVTLLDIDPGVLAYAHELSLAAVSSGHLLSLRWRDDSEDAVFEPRHIDFIQGSIHRLDEWFGEVFDFVFNEGIAHHWTDERRQGCLDQMVAVTRRGGVVAVQVSNALNAGMMEYAAKVDHTYMEMPPKQKPFEPEELERALVEAGLEHVVVVPVEATSFEASSIIMGYGSVGG